MPEQTDRPIASGGPGVRDLPLRFWCYCCRSIELLKDNSDQPRPCQGQLCGHIAGRFTPVGRRGDGPLGHFGVGTILPPLGAAGDRWLVRAPPRRSARAPARPAAAASRSPRYAAERSAPAAPATGPRRLLQHSHEVAGLRVRPHPPACRAQVRDWARLCRSRSSSG